nr:hypothetical protein [uncultured Rhodopila sp.]
MSAQLDLFGALPAPPRKPLVIPPPPKPPLAEFFPSPPTVTWARMLIEAGPMAQQVIWAVSAKWTGVVVESLQLAQGVRTLLYRDGSLHEVAWSPDTLGRFVFTDPAGAIALHKTHPLIQIREGWGMGRYRLARKGEVAPAELPHGWET